MPPKSKPAAPNKKTEAKKKEKVIEDKTFGLKNKKGAKQQRFIQQVEKQVKSGGVPARKLDDGSKTKDKDAKMKEQKEMNLLFKPVQKVEKGADPKTVLCAFFKQGQCTKGSKCKFSHDVALERKAEKRSMYVDMRDGDEVISIENEKFKELVERKEGDKNRPTTDIVCKFFLDAVENNRYGWFWSCPNGENCIYRHALPQGFILKKDKKKDDKKEEISLEELIEKERSSLASMSFTKITLESFIAWKKRKLKEKKEAAQKEEDKKRSDFKAGRHIGLSGREMFFFNPDLAVGDQMEDGDEALNSYEENNEDDDSNYQYREIELDLLEAEAQEVDDTGTQAPMPEKRFDNAPPTFVPDSGGNEANNAEPDGEAQATGVAINENLFLEDDLDELEQELEELELEGDSDNS